MTGNNMADPRLDKFRFGVYSGEKRRSSIWVAVANGDNLYIGTGIIMNRMKISLHASGVCQVAFAADYVQSIRERGIGALKSRTVARWRRPATPSTGALCVASIRFPSDLLRADLEAARLKKPLFRFEAAPAGKAVEIGFFYSSEQPQALETGLAQIGLPMIHWQCPSGTFVSVVGREISFDARIPPQLRRLGARGLLCDDLLQNAGDEMSNLSMVLFNHPEDGQPLIVTEVNGFTIRRELPATAGQPG